MLKRNKGVPVTIYTYDKSKFFELDLQKYNAQYADCPIEIHPNTDTHDRFLFIDDTAYHFGASLKDLGKKKVQKYQISTPLTPEEREG